MSLALEQPTWTVEQFLEERDRPGFTLVEFGHSSSPIIGNKSVEFRGQQSYIGIEAGMRLGLDRAEERARSLREQYADRNAFFMVHDLGKGEVVQKLGEADDEYKGDYNVQTLIPDGAADEVFIGNVFCDPLVGESRERSSKLLGEAVRIGSSLSTIVLRETITPWVALEHFGVTTPGAACSFVKQHGLYVVEKITPNEDADWKRLEAVYGARTEWFSVYDSSYYLFLQHASAEH